MNSPENLQQLAELFHEAVALEPHERAEFIARTRQSNPQLADAVESLIAAHEKSDNFMDAPAIEAAAEVLAENQPVLEAGQIVGHYQILKPLGKGGMGEVYLATDPKLDRNVALKLLPAVFTDSKERLRRFIQEAKAASSLNHPNIITIHEIGVAEGTHFIATEFIEGRTLRQLITEGPMKLSDILDVSIQAANALQSAHAAGIVHRDIKPENVMVRPDGYVKVLDFGLAKLTEKSVQSKTADSNIDTMVRAHTSPGAVLGTVKYMSPEQARGQVLDERTDVFSLGIVLYEMVAGRIPFSGATSMDTLVSILQNEPEPLEEFAPDTPAEFQRIISKALRKDREERYQTIKDLSIDLKTLKEDLSFQQKLDRSRPRRSTAEIVSTVTEPARTDPHARASSRHARTVAIVLPIVAIAAIGGILLWRKVASSPVGPTVPTATAPIVSSSLSYWITVQKYRDGKPYQDPFRLRDDINFEKDYRIRLNIKSAQSGRLYLLNEGPPGADATPTFNLLFPSETANNGSALLKENQEIQIPQQSWFQFDEQQGTEKMWIVWTKNVVPEMEAIKGFGNAKDRGVINSPGLRTAVNQFLKAASAPKVERDEDKKETVVKANSDVLVHAIRLEHH
jgi:serine/threonine protein kinase